MLFDVEEAQELHHAQSRHDHEMRRFDVIENSLQYDCNHTTLESKQYDVESEDIDDNNDSNLHSSNDDSTCKTLNERHCFFNTLTTFAIDFEVKCDQWHCYSLILILTNEIYLNILFFVRKSSILFSILLSYSFIYRFRLYTIMLTKILRFITHLARKKKRETKEIVIKKISERLKNLNSYTSLRRSRTLSMFETSSSAQRTMLN